MRLMRSAALAGYGELARSVGLDPLRMLAGERLPAACLVDPEIRMPVNAFVRLLEASAQRGNAPDFGLRLAQARGLAILGPIGLLAREQPTLRAALGTFAHYIWAHNDALALHIDDAGDIAIVRTSLDAPDAGPSRQAVELLIAVLLRQIAGMVAPGWFPEAVLFSHAAPADTRTHRRVLGVAPTFAAPLSGIVVTRADLDRPLAHADAGAAAQLEQYLALWAGRHRDDPVAAVRDLILALLPGGGAGIVHVAARLGVSRRTLHRRLAEHGTSFEAELAVLRLTLARSYFAEGGRSATEIADLLGYSSLSAFSRWWRTHR